MGINFGSLMDLGITGMVFSPSEIDGWRMSEPDNMWSMWEKAVDVDADSIDVHRAFLEKNDIKYVYFPPLASSTFNMGLLAIWPKDNQISLVIKRLT